MKFKISSLKRLSPLSVYCSIVAFFATVAPAMASTANSSGPLQINSVTGAINQITSLTSGPIAKLVAVIAIIGGAIAFSQGREINEGLRNLGIIAVVIGLLMAVSSLMGSVGATI
jgi:type IV secretory pathway VirB2 component (pilin)